MSHENIVWNYLHSYPVSAISCGFTSPIPPPLSPVLSSSPPSFSNNLPSLCFPLQIQRFNQIPSNSSERTDRRVELMERFSHRESILSGYNPERPSTNPSTPNRNSDVDFHDVFGGPPRRSSIQEIRYTVGQLPDRSGAQMAEEGGWRAVREKPVFGEENLNRRRFTNDNFYDDIFGGDESPSCGPRKHERGSRIMSPALPLSPASDSFAPSSLPSILRFPFLLSQFFRQCLV